MFTEKTLRRFKGSVMDSHRLKTAKIIGVIGLVHNTSARPHERNVLHNTLLLGRGACIREDEILEPLQ